MKPAPFQYVVPESLEEVMDILGQHGAEAKVLAGGQSLMPLLNMRLARPAVLVDINRLPGLDQIAVEDTAVEIPCLVRQRAAERSPIVAEELPLLREALRHVAHPQIRNRGTICGSIAHADPAAELALVLVALEGEVVAVGRGGERRIPANAFFRGIFTTALEADEVIRSVRIPRRRFSGQAFREFSPRAGDFALVAVAVALDVDPQGRVQTARVAVAAGSDVPARLTEVEARLQGAQAGAEAVKAAAAQAREAVQAGSDAHASEAYRRHLTEVLTEEALLAAMATTGGNVA
ncbi:MAG: xanthine dehydrogenase family protein subunit M [Firmicutes bacterium]|nr:xanthine dehydrogenase family protein subunit M [Bacillota bacterium]